MAFISHMISLFVVFIWGGYSLIVFAFQLEHGFDILNLVEYLKYSVSSFILYFILRFVFTKSDKFLEFSEDYFMSFVKKNVDM